MNSLKIGFAISGKLPSPLLKAPTVGLAKEGYYSSLWQREVRRDFTNQCIYYFETVNIFFMTLERALGICIMISETCVPGVGFANSPDRRLIFAAIIAASSMAHPLTAYPIHIVFLKSFIPSMILSVVPLLPTFNSGSRL